MTPNGKLHHVLNVLHTKYKGFVHIETLTNDLNYPNTRFTINKLIKSEYINLTDDVLISITRKAIKEMNLLEVIESHKIKKPRKNLTK